MKYEACKMLMQENRSRGCIVESFCSPLFTQFLDCFDFVCLFSGVVLILVSEPPRLVFSDPCWVIGQHRAFRWFVLGFMHPSLWSCGSMCTLVPLVTECAKVHR